MLRSSHQNLKTNKIVDYILNAYTTTAQRIQKLNCRFPRNNGETSPAEVSCTHARQWMSAQIPLAAGKHRLSFKS